MKKYTTNNLNDLSNTGIYKIFCKTNNKVYIGSASSVVGTLKRRGFYRRWLEHINNLNKNKHANRHLQSAWNKYGEDVFIFEIIEMCEPNQCIDKEMYYITLYDSTNHEKGFNIINQTNFKNTYISKEHRLKISNALKGKKRPVEIVKKWSKKVQQIDISSLNVIAEYYSMSEASRKTGIQRQDIGQSIIGIKCKTAGGYYWKIVEDIV